MAHRIALAMHKPLADIYAMDAGEFRAWCRYYETEPFGPAIDMIRFATIAALLANQVRDPKKKPEPFTLEDFCHGAANKRKLDIDRTPEELKAKYSAMMTRLKAATSG